MADFNNINMFGNYFIPPDVMLMGGGMSGNFMADSRCSMPIFNFMNVDSDLISMALNQQNMLFNMFNTESIDKSAAEPTVSKKNVADNSKVKLSGKFSEAVQQQIRDIAQELNFNPKDLEKIIMRESGGNPQAVNKKGGASGLIQFMPKTAKGLGTSVEELRTMTAEQQMPFVKKYLKQMKKMAGFKNGEQLSSSQLYALIFMPAKAKCETLCSEGSLAYSWNKGLDKDHDGRITQSDLA